MGCLSLKSLEEIPMEHKLSAVQVLLHTCSIEIIALKKKGVPIFKAFRKGAGTPPRVALHIERKAQTVNRVGSGREGTKLRDLEAKYPKEKAQKLAALLKSPRAMALGPGFPKWWGGVEFWNQYPIFEHTNQPCPLENHISAIKPSLQDGIVYCDPIQHFITF